MKGEGDMPIASCHKFHRRDGVNLPGRIMGQR